MIAELLKKFGTFSEAEIQILENRLVERKVQKGEALLKLGEVCQSIYFINVGAFIQYNFKNELEQNIIDLYLKNDWILNQQCLVRQEPSETIIEAFVESYVFVLNLHTLHDLIAQSPAFLQLGKIFEPTHSRIQFFDNS